MTEPSTASFSGGGWLGALPYLLIALSLLGIAAASVYAVRRREERMSPALAWAAGASVLFLVALALMQILDAWSVWQGQASGSALATVSALVGIAAAVGLWRIMPSVASFPSRAELQASKDALARANAELETFTASVSHDLRAPLTSIAGQAGMLELTLGENIPEDQRRRLQRLQGSVKQMSELIDALVMLSRTTRQPLAPETVDVSAIAAQIVADLRHRDPHRNVTVAIQPDMKVRGDRRLLTDAFAQLIGNAWKFTSKNDGACIEIAQAPSAEPALLVRDNGVGFDMAYHDKLFQPFKRLHGPSEFEGAGVGLAMVSRIVERHCGRIWAEAKPNAGAVFYVELPQE